MRNQKHAECAEGIRRWIGRLNFYKKQYYITQNRYCQAIIRGDFDKCKGYNDKMKKYKDFIKFSESTLKMLKKEMKQAQTEYISYMKVIKHGNTVFPKQHTCKECNCIFEYEEADLETEVFEAYPMNIVRERSVYQTVKCPECKKPYRVLIDSKLTR